MKRIYFLLTLFICTTSFAQEFNLDIPLLKAAFKLATQIFSTNTCSGVLPTRGDYGGESTSDIEIYSWYAVSLMLPKVAEGSFCSVTIKKDSGGHRNWDEIIGASDACNHYKVNVYRKILSEDYRYSANTMKDLENFISYKNYIMFIGPPVFNDGIAFYQKSISYATDFYGGSLDHKNTQTIKYLIAYSRYCGAYIALAKTSAYLVEKPEVNAGYIAKALRLKANTLKCFYDKDKNKLSYLIEPEGKLKEYQEGLGIPFANIFGVIEGHKVKQLLRNATVSNYGIISIIPDSAWYNNEMTGRHGNIIRPSINGFSANTALKVKNYATFDHEFFAQVHLVIEEDKSNYNFWEIFNANTGKHDGGYQDWDQDDQIIVGIPPNCKPVWKWTYISIITNWLLGMKFNEDTLSFTPYIPVVVNWIKMKDILYRKPKIDISSKGKVNTIKVFCT